jgi:hypothetical protein
VPDLRDEDAPGRQLLRLRRLRLDQRLQLTQDEEQHCSPFRSDQAGKASLEQTAHAWIESVRSEDFRGLRHLANRLGDRFRAGIVLYAGEQQLSFGDRLTALPMAGLWMLDGSAS